MTILEEVIVELSYNCNLSCSMCGFGKAHNPFDRSKFLTFERFKSILHQIGGRAKAIRLNGRGESTIHPNFVEILSYTRENCPGAGINLFSNFSFRSRRTIESLIHNNVQLFVSIDSPIPHELAAIRLGAKFEFIEENIKQIRKLPSRPFIIFTIQEANLHRIYDIAKFAFDNDCQMLFNTIRRDEGVESFVEMVKAQYDEVLEQFEKVEELYSGSALQCLYPDQLAGIRLAVSKPTQTHGTMQECPALNKEICILYDGTVTPCNMFNPYVYGNIFAESLEEVWTGQERMKFLVEHKDHSYCRNCANIGL